MLSISKLLSFLKNNVVLIIAITIAAVTSIIVLPDEKYFSYFDFKTLTCLFCTLGVVCAFKNINFFYIIALKIVKFFKNLRASILALVYITFIGSMLIANDMALITFLPLGYYVLVSANKKEYMAFTFIMQNIAANLGGMLTPFGNPQNLYLYSHFNISNKEFISIMFPPFIISILLITICCLFIKKEPLLIKELPLCFNIKRIVIYALLFVFTITIVFNIVPYYFGFIIITVSLLFCDRGVFKKIDYSLLLTFVAFFIFAGNMARIEYVRCLFEYLLNQNTLFFSILSCQFISNVPSAVLLSQFTADYSNLLVGVNIGGTGTLIASLASLITFREYAKYNPEKIKKYVVLFFIFNFGFLFILTSFMFLIN